MEKPGFQLTYPDKKFKTSSTDAEMDSMTSSAAEIKQYAYLCHIER
jgi:hypothetical protein